MLPSVCPNMIPAKLSLEDCTILFVLLCDILPPYEVFGIRDEVFPCSLLYGFHLVLKFEYLIISSDCTMHIKRGQTLSGALTASFEG